MAKLKFRSRGHYLYVVLVVLILTLLLVGDLVLHWPDWLVPVGAALTILSNFLVVDMKSKDISRHG